MANGCRLPGKLDVRPRRSWGPGFCRFPGLAFPEAERRQGGTCGAANVQLPGTDGRTGGMGELGKRGGPNPLTV